MFAFHIDMLHIWLICSSIVKHLLQDFFFLAYTLAQHDENARVFYATICHCMFLWKKTHYIRFKVKYFAFIFTLKTLPMLSLIKHHLSSNITLKPFSISCLTLSKFWSMLNTYNTFEMYFKSDRLFIATIHLPLKTIQSPF